jgi:hypothetical protein
MKKTIKIFAFILAVTSVMMIQSCKEDDPIAPPALTAPSSTASVQVGTKADVTFTFVAPGKYKSSSVTATGGTATVKTPPAADATEGTVVVEFTAGTAAGAGSVVLTFTDNSDQVVSATAVLNVTISAPPSLTLSATSGAGNPGTTVAVTATITAPNGASTLTITGATSTPASPITITGTSPTQAVTLAIPSSAVVGSTISAVFTVKDAQNLNSTAVTFTINVSDPTNILQGNLTTQTLDATKPYLLKGQVFIPNGVTLTIPEGTVIKGDKTTKATLIVQPGGKLIANGTAAKPVVFTSAQGVGERDRGDWGGVVMLGNAFVNQAAKPAIEGITPTQNYGSSLAESATPATNATENSGTLTYVRIEYAGIELTPNNETNSLTMGGVGNGTTISYVQVSYGGDDGFEWFGGTVNGKYLVSHSTWDDDFDTDFGWGGNVQYGLVVRNTSYADQSGSNAFESDNQANGAAITGVCDGTNNTGCTRGIFSNITVLGPREIQSRAISGNFQNAAHIRRRSAISIFNSFFSGFRVGIRIDDQGTLDNLNSGAGKHAYNVLTVPGTTLVGTTTTAADAAFATGLTIAPDPAGTATAISTYWTANTNTGIAGVTALTTITDLGITGSLYFGTQTAATYPSNPNFALVAGVVNNNNLNSGAVYSDAKFTGNTFFRTTDTFRGAFGTTDWTDGWAEFQPLNKVY